MTDKFAGKTVLVTGSAGGLGRAFALAFARQGAALVLADVNEAGLSATKRLIEDVGSRAVTHKVDLSSETEIQALAAKILAVNDTLDVLVNNAGIAYGDVSRGFFGLGQAKWLHFLSVNSIAPLLLAEALRPALARAKGLIINVSSMASYTPGNIYGVSKALLNAINFALAMQLGADEIRSVAIAPGLMETDANRASLPPELFARVVAAQSVKRQGTAEDIANMGVFLASEEGSFINSEVILVDGGNSMRGFHM